MRHTSSAVAVMAFLGLLLAADRPASAFYHPQIGRFLQRDPVGYLDGANLYEYAVSAPELVVDPAGRAVKFTGNAGYYNRSLSGDVIGQTLAAFLVSAKCESCTETRTCWKIIDVTLEYRVWVLLDERDPAIVDGRRSLRGVYGHELKHVDVHRQEFANQKPAIEAALGNSALGKNEGKCEFDTKIKCNAELGKRRAQAVTAVKPLVQQVAARGGMHSNDTNAPAGAPTRGEEYNDYDDPMNRIGNGFIYPPGWVSLQDIYAS